MNQLEKIMYTEDVIDYLRLARPNVQDVVALKTLSLGDLVLYTYPLVMTPYSINNKFTKSNLSTYQLLVDILNTDILNMPRNEYDGYSKVVELIRVLYPISSKTNKFLKDRNNSIWDDVFSMLSPFMITGIKTTQDQCGYPRAKLHLDPVRSLGTAHEYRISSDLDWQQSWNIVFPVT